MEEMPILITKKNCQKCEWIKNRIAREQLEVTIIDAESVSGMAHLSYHELYNASEPTMMPVLIINDNHVIKGETIQMMKELRVFKESKSI